ncbi:MAG: NPCBM/NEW2 domain-containing protein, partial [Candidatus Hydrogenedentes bacterium]|nr:NPCBM/NEW2 domain-containing protein [Candidatus Hydrogenedentota bacterium]
MRFAATVVLILCLPLSAEEKKQLPQAETGVLLGRLLVHTQGWGELGIDTCAYSSTKTALPLKIGTQEYGQGLGMHAPGELVVALEGAFERFDAEAGVQWQGQNAGSVVFQVFVDGEKQFDSGILRESDGARPVSVPLRGAEELRIVVTDAGDGITCDCANWANARLVPVQGAPQAGTLPRLDIAPFARVITCDPSRKDGVRATRVQPFPAEDLLLTREILPDAQGHYVLAPDSNGLAVIGLEWTERRMLRRVGLRFAGHAPDPAKATLQFWAGESPWQGEWVPVEEPVIASVDGWEVALSVVKTPALRRGTEKVRWVLETDETAVVTSVSAHTLSSLEEVSLRLEMGPALPGQRAGVQVYNGAFLAAGVAPYHFDWDLGRPAEVRVLNTRARYSKTDRTVLRFHLPQTNVAVAVQDVLEHGAVYVPEA